MGGGKGKGEVRREWVGREWRGGRGSAREGGVQTRG
jgi:hypothetical protein